MNILILNGSRRNGHTAQLAEDLASEVTRLSPGTVARVTLAETPLDFCISCHRCFNAHESVCKDASVMAGINDAIAAADVLFIATPVYAMQLSARLKNWLDHCAYFVHRPRHFHKRAVIVTTTAGAGTGNVVRYLKQLLPMWGITSVYALPCTLFADHYEKTPAIARKIQTLAAKLAEDHQARHFRCPSYYHISLHAMFRALNHHYAPEHYERLYWEQTGLLNTVYAGPSRLGLLKRAYGILLFSLLKKSLAGKVV